MLVLDYNQESGLYQKDLESDTSTIGSAFKSLDDEVWMHALFRTVLPSGEEVYLWTAGIDLEFEGNFYIGTRVLNISDFGQSSLQSGSQSLSISITSIIEDDRKHFRRAIGAPEIIIQLIASVDRGENWALVGRQIKGTIEEPTMQGGTYSFSVALKNIEVSNIRTRVWSHEDRVRRFGLEDQGAIQMKTFDEEKVLGVWPQV